jgi:hypothetical protein
LELYEESFDAVTSKQQQQQQQQEQQQQFENKGRFPLRKISMG